jgi:hypothetical protein
MPAAVPLGLRQSTRSGNCLLFSEMSYGIATTELTFLAKKNAWFLQFVTAICLEFPRQVGCNVRTQEKQEEAKDQCNQER